MSFNEWHISKKVANFFRVWIKNPVTLGRVNGRGEKKQPLKRILDPLYCQIKCSRCYLGRCSREKDHYQNMKKRKGTCSFPVSDTGGNVAPVSWKQRGKVRRDLNQGAEQEKACLASLWKSKSTEIIYLWSFPSQNRVLAIFLNLWLYSETPESGIKSLSL